MPTQGPLFLETIALFVQSTVSLFSVHVVFNIFINTCWSLAWLQAGARQNILQNILIKKKKNEQKK